MEIDSIVFRIRTLPENKVQGPDFYFYKSIYE